MVAVTYGVARVPAAEPAAKAKPAAKAEPSKSWFVRLMDMLIEARMQQARREIAMHGRLMPPFRFDERADRLVKTDAKDMPFGGW